MQSLIERLQTQLSGKQPLIRPLIILAVITALCLIPLRIISYGYMPSDDALRHVAKVVSGRPWQDILVMREGKLVAEFSRKDATQENVVAAMVSDTNAQPEYITAKVKVEIK